MGYQLWDTRWGVSADGMTAGDWILEPPPPVYVDPLIEDEIEFSGEVHITNTGGLQALDPLGTAVLIALFTDARLPDFMLGRFGFTKADQHEWHGNTFSIDKNMGEEPLGSLLWTLRRAPLLPYTARLAEHFVALALQPLVRQDRIQTYSVDGFVNKGAGRIDLHVRTYEPERQFRADITPLK